jgi:hypothetical protein
MDALIKYVQEEQKKDLASRPPPQATGSDGQQQSSAQTTQEAGGWTSWATSKLAEKLQGTSMNTTTESGSAAGGSAVAAKPPPPLDVNKITAFGASSGSAGQNTAGSPVTTSFKIAAPAPDISNAKQDSFWDDFNSSPEQPGSGWGGKENDIDFSGLASTTAPVSANTTGDTGGFNTSSAFDAAFGGPPSSNSNPFGGAGAFNLSQPRKMSLSKAVSTFPQPVSANVPKVGGPLRPGQVAPPKKTNNLISDDFDWDEMMK